MFRVMHDGPSAYLACPRYLVGMFLLLVVASPGCGRMGQGRAYPLYPNPGQPRPPEELARLMGPIATVDGQKVASKGNSFALLPGCHVVTLYRKVSENAGNSAWSADLPPIVYVFQMNGGNSYEIEVVARFGGALRKNMPGEKQIFARADILGPSASGSTHGQVAITAKERDSAGRVVNVLPPTDGEKAVEACHEEASSPR
jgi:hypothetical protein